MSELLVDFFYPGDYLLCFFMGFIAFLILNSLSRLLWALFGLIERKQDFKYINKNNKETDK